MNLVENRLFQLFAGLGKDVQQIAGDEEREARIATARLTNEIEDARMLEEVRQQEEFAGHALRPSEWRASGQTPWRAAIQTAPRPRRLAAVSRRWTRYTRTL